MVEEASLGDYFLGTIFEVDSNDFRRECHIEDIHLVPLVHGHTHWIKEAPTDGNHLNLASHWIHLDDRSEVRSNDAAAAVQSDSTRETKRSLGVVRDQPLLRGFWVNANKSPGI